MKIFFSNMTCVLALTTSSLAFAAPQSSFKLNGEVGGGLIFNSALSIDELDEVSSQSDNGYEYNGEVKGKWQLTDNAKLSSSYAYNQKTYSEYSQYDLALHQLSVDGSYKINRSEIGVRVDGASASVAGETFLNYQQASLYLGHFIQPETYLRTSVKVKNKSFSELSARDASGFGTTFDMFHFMDGANTMLIFGLSAEKENAQDSQFDYFGLGIHTKITHKFSLFGLSSKVGLGLRYQKKDYQSLTVETLQAADTNERDENRQVIEANWDLHLLDNLSVKTELQHGDFKSQLESQTYQQTTASVGLKYTF
ncbi:surface lipoprotein assembly modifier [Paraglaciecola sp. MB-3u-78]|jgi:hypothetical protein|uniref:surface lipoprotein assembly modifier n=1 Tax=Paraglaciecola sp. MB-3u-78 TaxID=2058332 RepID=UPI000C343E83|nr:surface lipoprotein assembly modifier [Paraglaciecola sp. MB-3u-78]PKG98695.1 hypothetical protein CXF95_12565 [Paraglaciecola sp. MB-3u-78]